MTNDVKSPAISEEDGTSAPFLQLLQDMREYIPEDPEAREELEEDPYDFELRAEFALESFEEDLLALTDRFVAFRSRLEAEALKDRAIAVRQLDAYIAMSSANLAYCQRALEAGSIAPARATGYACSLIWQRGIAVAHEVGALLRCGLSTGAEGRWRTLLEAAVVAAVLESGNRFTAQRFIDHRSVQLWSDLQSDLTDGTVPEDIAKRLARDHARLIKKYGKSFTRPYGWASEIVPQPKGRGQLTLWDLMEIAQIEHHHALYRQAHHRVHADSLGGITLLDPATGLLHAGATYHNVERICVATMDLLLVLNDYCIKMFYRRRTGGDEFPMLLSLNYEIFLTLSRDLLFDRSMASS